MYVSRTNLTSRAKSARARGRPARRGFLVSGSCEHVHTVAPLAFAQGWLDGRSGFAQAGYRYQSLQKQATTQASSGGWAFGRLGFHPGG